jgi:Mg/Co/Ni transporter MgtE
MTYDRELREDAGVGTIVGVVLSVIVVLAIVWFFFLGGMKTGRYIPAVPNNPITVNQPAEHQLDGGLVQN